MKKMTSLLLCIVLMVCISGCASEEPALTVPVAFYYRTTATSYDGSVPIIDHELRESAGFDGNTLLLLNAYFNGPNTEELISPFPRTLKAVNFSAPGSTAVVELSNDIAQLSGIDLTIACACLASTILSLDENWERVQISASTSYLDGSSSITMDRGNILLLDIADTPAPTEELNETTAETAQ